MNINYLVSYTVINTKVAYAPANQKVTLTEGYSNFESIRGIIAMRRGLKVENIQVEGLMKLDS